MATGSRTLKLSILADVDQLNKSLKAANADVENSSNSMLEFGKKAGLAFAAAAAAAGAYAIKIGVDGVKAAIEDEQSQVKLASALENATGATKGQIAATEQSILKMSLATGVADDKLRPALSRLAISTGDISKAQDLLALSLDISTQTGKPLEAVANSIGKAFDGNTAALGKLGVGLSSAELKTMTFTQVQQRLSDLFGGAAAKNAETFQGRMDVLKTTLNEAKETIGYALLPILETLVNYFVQYVVPIVEKLSGAFGDKTSGLTAYIEQLGETLASVFIPIWNGLVKAFDSIKSAVQDNLSAFMELGGYISKYLAPIVGTILGGAFDTLGKIVSGLVTLVGGVARAINAIVSTTIDAINALINAYNRIPILPNISTIPKTTTSNNTSNNLPGSGAKPPGGTDTTTTDTTTKKDLGGSFSTGGIELPKSVTNNLTGNTNISAAGAATALEKIANAGGTGGVAGAGTTDSQNWARLQAAAEKLGGAFTDSQNAARTAGSAVASALGGSVNTSTLAGILKASGTTINLTVNGAIDSEGTARTIVDTLNNSTNRGTNGAANLVYL
jgi:hypothetical protein